MTYYDPKVYDPSKLTGDDALVMEGFDICAETVINRLEKIAESYCGGLPMFDEVYRQVAGDILETVKGTLGFERIELTVSLMEADPQRYTVE